MLTLLEKRHSICMYVKWDYFKVCLLKYEIGTLALHLWGEEQFPIKRIPVFLLMYAFEEGSLL